MKLQHKLILVKNNCRSMRAFTLLETLASIAIISTFILGPLTVAINSSSYARQAKDVMVATYLAEESAELLHNQYDSLRIRCHNTLGVAPCVEAFVGETYEQIAWRVFKERLSLGGADCLLSSGCNYDFIDMATTTDVTPTTYATSSVDCPTLALVSKYTPGDLYARSMYVCSGVLSHSTGVVGAKAYSRSVVITSSSTFAEVGTKYNDDLRIVATISFRRPNGYLRSVKIVDFLHAYNTVLPI